VYDILLADYVFELITNFKAQDRNPTAHALWAISLIYSLIYSYQKSEQARQIIENERNMAKIQALKA